MPKEGERAGSGHYIRVPHQHCCEKPPTATVGVQWKCDCGKV